MGGGRWWWWRLIGKQYVLKQIYYTWLHLPSLPSCLPTFRYLPPILTIFIPHRVRPTPLSVSPTLYNYSPFKPLASQSAQYLLSSSFNKLTRICWNLSCWSTMTYAHGLWLVTWVYIIVCMDEIKSDLNKTCITL